MDNKIKISLFSSDGVVQYGLNWGHRDNRNPNQSYLQLPVEVYKSDFFPSKGKYFVVKTDDAQTIIMNRAQKTENGTALQTPDDNSILGKYIRYRLGLKDGAFITAEDIIEYGRSDIEITKIDSLNFKLDFSNQKETVNLNIINEPQQQIIFGAPGTGKSHSIKCNTNINEGNSTRTTFHPDSDYSTFVGCYKPVKKVQKNNPLIAAGDLIEQASAITGVADQVQFICDNAESIITAADEKGVSTNKLIWDCFKWHNETYFVSFLNSLLTERKKNSTGEITYDFTPQAFTNAYVKAWLYPNEAQFLIIEEINRGNCAQIFGDIFQLLDRDENGYSSYKITPDKDLENYLCEQFAEADIKDAEIKSGTKMQLPPNLFIWATMNTSDQSLFPIDSAFKRRWDWKYIPIDYTDKGHYISVGEQKYEWADFLQKVNEKIEAVTQSEDKKLGYWFVARKDQPEISADKFVSKVIFYLWNDIFKDCAFNGNSIFKEGYGKFHKFFDTKGEADTNVLTQFLENLKVKKSNEGMVSNTSEPTETPGAE